MESLQLKFQNYLSITAELETIIIQNCITIQGTHPTNTLSITLYVYESRTVSMRPPFQLIKYYASMRPPFLLIKYLE